MSKSTKTKKTNKAIKITLKTLLILLITLKWLLISGLIAGLFAGGVIFGYVTSLVKDEPIRDKQLITSEMNLNDITGFVYFNDDTVVGQLRSEVDRRIVETKEIPPFLKDAFIALEDRKFEEHNGVVISSILRAAKQKFLDDEVQTGGSTITQQLARRVFLSLDRTDSRKFKEIFLSLRMERYMSKDEIFTAYLNKIPFGNGSTGYNLYGIKAAAKGIFDVETLDGLNIAQAAYLAGLPQMPSTYSAFTSKGEFDSEGFGYAIERQGLVLRRMLQEQKITKQQYDDALNFDLRASLAKSEKKAYSTYPYLMLETEKRAVEILLMKQNPNLTLEDIRNSNDPELMNAAKDHLLRGGYKIYTTIDKQIYDKMHEIKNNPEHFSPDHEEHGLEEVGAMMIDNHSGAILGMIEGRDFYVEQLNHATQMVRQPGSTMKPISAFLPALEKGLIQPASIIDDVPMILPDGSKGYHLPMNWDGKFHGLITARHALNQSYNIPALKIFLDEVGIEDAWAFTRKLGITTLTEEDNYARTGVIGGLSYGVSVEELTNAYSTIANKGVHNDAYMIRKIEDSEGRIIFEHVQDPISVFSEQTAYLMTDMLKTVVTNGTAYGTLKEHFKYFGEMPVAGKTGSTQIDDNAWYMGYSPEITVGVWIGYDQPATLSSAGKNRAKYIWSQIMNETVELKPEMFSMEDFSKPEDIITMTVSDVSGKLPSELTRETGHLLTDIFNKAFIPTEEDDALVKAAAIQYKKRNYIPLDTTPQDFLQEKIFIQRPKPLSELMEEIEDVLKKLAPQHRPKKRGGYMEIQDFYPSDVSESAPTEVDPRTEDGSIPAPPNDVALENVESAFRITFKESSSEDVIGYRLYRSMNGQSYKRVSGVVLSGDDLKFVNYGSSLNSYSFYIAAVDVAGQESAPSKIIYSDENASNLDLFPPLNQEGVDEEGSNTDQNEDDNETAPVDPTVPKNISIVGREGGIGIVMNWTANLPEENIKEYAVYYSDSLEGLYRKIGSTAQTSFQYISVPIEGWYRIVAISEEGKYSNPSPSIHFEETE
jgi:penicillin-binding protein